MTPADGPVLRDIHLPPAPGWWPPAPGWWLLAGICILCLFLTIIALRRLAKGRRQRRAVLRELECCIDRARDDPIALAAALSNFLRRLALREAPAAAAYDGERWLEYLDRHSDSRDEFRHGIGRVLIEAPFRTTMNYDTPALIALVRRWTRDTLTAGAMHA
jgi:hypothetical protein